tara:strand:+ start:312 stop:599 length:288 start_codon:yes stop_codon:yes gene_type:complete
MSLVESHSLSNAERTGELLSLAPTARSEDTTPDARGGSFIRDLPEFMPMNATLPTKREADKTNELMKNVRSVDWRNPSANAFQSDYFYNQLATIV